MLLQKFIVIACFVLTLSAQTCQPKFVLPNTVQDQVVLQSFSNDQSSSTYTYKFSPSFFSDTPTPLLSISSFSIKNFAQINYLLTSQLQTNNLVIKLQSQNMRWTSLKVQFILHSRNDIFSQIIVVDSVQNVQKKVDCIKKATPSSDSLLFVHNILGIKALYSTKYHFAVEPAQISTGKGQYSVMSSTNASFTIQTIYFDSLTTNFAFGVKQISWTSNKATYLQQLWFQFAPVVYTLVGINQLSFGGFSVQAQTIFDINTNAFKIKGSTDAQSIDAVMLAIGVASSEVCSPCQNFITQSSCIDQCPSNSYPYSFPSGGKTCRSCNKLQGQSLSQTGISCNCLGGLEYYQGNCYNKKDVPPKCKNDQLLINKKCINKDIGKILKCPSNAHPNSDLSSCICDSGFDQVNSECLPKCPKNSKRTTYGLCACDYGYIMNSARVCQSICPLNSVYRTDLKICKCNQNYQMINGVCSQCPAGQVYDPTTSSCLAAFHNIGKSSDQISLCKAHQVVVNNQCVCDQWSVESSNGHCYPCPPTTFKKISQCLPCPNYCLNCSSQNSCNSCRRGFDIISGTCIQKCGDGRRYVVECDDGNNRNGDGCSSDCKVEKGYLCSGGSQISTDLCQKIDPNAKKMSLKLQRGYPVYLSGGIITDFILDPPVVRSQGQLSNIFKIVFSQDQARPNTIFLSQSESDPASVRCMFSYNSDLPNSVFSVSYNVEDNTYGSDFITWTYDTMGNSITSALQMPDSSDVLT